jgi:hypothetical protein
MTEILVNGFCQGFDIEAAVEDAVSKVDAQTNRVEGFTLIEIKFSRGGVVGPATHVKLIYQPDEDA